MQTTGCSRFGHPEFRISIDPAAVPVEGDARWLISWLEGTVAAGQRFADGETCQVGWLLAMVRRAGDGLLTLWEPDMSRMPIEWTESVSRTLADLRLQKDVCESVPAVGDPLFPSMRESAIVCTQIGPGEGVVMERAEPSGADSGWFFGCLRDGHDHNDAGELRRVSLYEAAVRIAPQIVPFLALPAGVLLEAGGAAPSIFFHGKQVEFGPGTFLASRYARN